MARFNGIPIEEASGGSFGGIPVEDEAPKPRSVLDVVSGGIGSIADTASDSINAAKSGVGALLSQTGTVLDDPAAFGKMALTSVGDVALTGVPRLASTVSRWAGGSGELPLGMDRGAQEIHELFSPAYDKYGRELAQARKQADAEGSASSVLRSMGSQVQEDAQAALSPEAKSRNAEYDKTTGFGALGYLATHPGKAVDMTLENLPSQVPLLATGYAGGALMNNIAGRAASAAGAAALKEAALSPAARYAQVLGTPAQKAAAEAAAKASAEKSAQVAAENAIATATPYLTALNIGGESSMTVAQAADAIQQSVQKAKPEDLASLPLYQQYLSETGNDSDARTLLAARLTAEWAPVAGMGTTFGSVVTGGARAEAMALAGQVSGYKQAAKGVGKEMLEEAIQNPLEDLAQHQAQIQVDPTDTYDPIKSSVEGAVVSMGHSGAIQFAKPVKDSISKLAQRGQEVGTQDGGNALPPAGGEALTADNLLGGPEQPQQSESDKALYTPKSLTALDRVNEIDLELAKLNDQTTGTPEQTVPGPDGKPVTVPGKQPEFFTPEQKAEFDALKTERDSITETWPKAVAGKETTFSTETGARLDAQYALMDAGDLTTSHDESLRPVPTYPTELQPRERERHASEMQVQQIVQRLDPARLGESADVATGAPIVGADGLVESGNARTIALKRVYQANGQKALDYKQFLKDNAERFGLTPESVDALQKPVLVRIRNTPVNRAEFARQANASTVARMSPSEQARSDAATIDNLDDLNPDESGDFVPGTSRPFVRRFLAKLPGTEQAGLIDSTGALSQAGYTRVRNAVLAKAYGDSPVLLRMTESLDDNTRNLSKALLRVAPAVAKVREAIGEGALHDVDITPDLVSAVEHLSTLREKGVSVEQDMAQTGMFGDKLSPEGREMLAFLNENQRSPRRIAEFVQAYMDALAAAGNPAQHSMFGETAAPAKADLLTAARKSTYVEPNQAADGSSAVNEENRGESANPPGDQARAGSDEATARARAAEDFDGALNDLGAITRKYAGVARLIPEDAPAMMDAMTRLFGAAIRLGYHDTKKAIAYVREKLKADPRFKTIWNKIQQATYLKAARKAVEMADSAPAGDMFAKPAAEEEWVNFGADSGTLGIPRAEMPQVKLPLRPALYQFLETLGVTHTKEDVAADTLKPSQAEYSPAKAHNAKELEGNKAEVLVSSDGYVLDGHHRWLSRALLHESVPIVRFSVPIRELIADVRKFPGATKNPESAGKADSVTAQNYDYKRDNYKPPLPPDFMTKKQLEEADAYIEKYYGKGQKIDITAEDRARAEELLKPLLAKAEEAKADYDQKIIDIAKRTAALGQMLAPLKSVGRAAEKLVNEAAFKTEKIKDLLRSTIAVSSYVDAQAVVDEIRKEFKIDRIKNRTGHPITGDSVIVELRQDYGGYADVMVNVVMQNGTIAEIQINVPEMLSIKEYKGHKLYEAARDQHHASPLKAEIYAAMQGIYDAAFDAANSRDALAAERKPDGSSLTHTPPLGSPLAGSKVTPSSERPNTLPSGNRTNHSPPKVGTNSEPLGNLSGTLISSISKPNIAQDDLFAYTDGSGKSSEAQNEHREAGTSGTQGKEPGAASATGAERKAAGVRQRPGRGNIGSENNADDGDSQQTRPASSTEDRPNQGGRDNEHGGQAGNGNRARRDAGFPAGRDIPAKSGRNYRFGDNDLTYAGSWQTKARQNVEAVELLKKLQDEGRQAARDEQAVLAKFIGWGSSEIANSIFGDKLDKQLEALDQYKEAMDRLAETGRDFLAQRETGFYQAFNVLNAKTPGLSYYSVQRITKVELQRAKPDASVAKWGELRDRLKAALTKEEWDASSRSTQYAHYTSKPVVNAMLAAVVKMGFKGGTVLEPGAGIGVFPGLMPTEMGVNSVYTGIEFDPITGGILKQLFPDERILVESFVDSKLPENFYDIAFGNPPFGGFKVLADPKYAKLALALHDYFFAKTIDSVKPGGLVVFVTSRYTMDKKDDKARAYMAERADLVGAIRLPQTAFQKNAGTEVVTDVLFLRKKVPGETFDKAQPWAGLGEVQTEKGKVPVNEYFAAHPEMVLGTHSRKGSMYGKDQYTVLPNGSDIEAQFKAATESLPADVFVEGRGSAAEAAKVREMDFNPKAKKEGSFYVTDAGVLMQREGGVGVRAEEKHQKNAPMLKDYIKLRDAVKQSQYDQLNDGDWESSLKALQKTYAGFTKKNGSIFQNTTYMQKVKVDELDDEGVPTGAKVEDEEQRRRFPVLSKIADDPEYTLVAALEIFNDETGEIKASDWLTKRTLGAPAKAEIKTPTDALLATLNDTGKVDIGTIADKVGLSDQETIDTLGTLIYESPGQGWVMADEYLSGDVKKKLAEAVEAAKSDKRYARNVEALKAVQPTPKASGDITPQIGMNWIPGEVYEQFLQDLTGVQAKVEYVERTHEWSLEAISGDKTPRATSDWGVGDKANASWLMEKALTGAAIRLNKTISDGKGGSTTVFDPDRTEAAIQKRAQMREEFQKWLFQDAERTDKLVQLYNDKFNTTVQRSFDGSHLTLPGTSKLFNVFDHVKRGAWRIIQTGNTYLAHAVGSGKTFEMVISAMEQKRLGKIKKPMVIVPGHMLQQFATEWQQLYPTARLMVADEKDFHTDNRRRFVSRVAMSDLDGVIMTHSSFGLLDLDPAFKQKMIEQELEFLRASYEEAGGDLDDIGNKKVRKDPKIKRIEAQIERLEQQLAKTMSSDGKDKNVRFDEMGVDFLYVDEAHLFRKLSYATNRQMKGIDPNGSQMAWDLFMKSRWLAQKNPDRSLVFASGTPITNTTAELYTVQRFMAPQVLEDKGLTSFDDWAAQFGEEGTAIEATSSGKYEPVTRFSKFVNVGEMTQMFRDFADVLNEDHLAALLGDKRPKVAGGARNSVITPKTESYARFQEQDLAPRIETSKKWKPSFEQQYNPDPIININTDARLAAIDMRFMEPTLPNDPDSKLNRLIDGVIRTYKETAGNEYKDSQGRVEPLKGATQMVFFESGFGRMAAQRRGFNARAWMEKRLRDAGIPASQLAFMEDYKKSSAKLKLFKEVNTGKVRVLVGSSGAMGTGVNAQQRLIALHHLDAPMVPAVLEQREGRIVRQGNKNPLVQIYAYSMKGSFDENQWGMLARKKFFIEQALSGDPNIRSIEDVGDVNQLEMAAALVAENPYVMQLAGVRAEVEKLTRLYRNHEEQRGRMRGDYESAGRTIAMNEQILPDAEKAAGKVKDLTGDNFEAKADGKTWNKRKDWGDALMTQFKALSDKLTEKATKVGEISGFDVTYYPDTNMEGKVSVGRLLLMLPEPVSIAWDALADPVGVSLRAVNALVALTRKPIEMRRIIGEAKSRHEALESRLNAPFPLSEQLANKVKEASEIEKEMLAYGKEKTGAEREQELTDEWQRKTGAITPMFSKKEPGLPAGDRAGKLRYDEQAKDDIGLLEHILGKGKDVPAGTFRAVRLPDDAALRAIASAFGKRVIGVRAQEVPKGFPGITDWQGVTLPGLTQAIYLNESSPRPHLAILGHELVHQLQADNPTLYKEFADAVDGYVKAEEYDTKFAEKFGIKDASKLREEFLGEVVSDGFMSERFWNALGDANPTLLGKVVGLVRGLMEKATKALGYKNKTSPYLTDFDAVMDIAGRAMAKYTGEKSNLSRGSGAGMALRDLQAVADRVSKGFKNLPRVHVMSSPSDLSTKDSAQKALRDFIRKHDAWGDVEGATHDGEIYLFASGMADEARAEHVLATHELTHYGLRGAMGKDMDSALQHVLLMNANVRKAAVALKEKNKLASNLDAVEEVLADIPTADLAKLHGWRKVVQVVRNWLNKAGAKALVARLDKWLNSGLTEQQQADVFVADLLTAAREWVKTGKGGSGVATMGGTRLAEQKLADDLAGQEKWLEREAKMRGYKSIDELAEKNYPAFENLAALWRKKHPVEGALLSRAATAQQNKTPEQRAEEIIQEKSATPRPIDALVRIPTQALRLDRLTMAAYDKAGALLDRYTPETIKAGVVSDYGIPEAVIDRRAIMQGRQKQQLRAAGALLEKLSTLTRAESRVAYEWMNSADPQSADYFRDQLPPDSIKVLADVEKMIDDLSKEAVRLGQLDPEVFKKNRFAYLRRSYVKHTAELTKGEAGSRARAISILGDQYKGRGMTDAVDMAKIKNGAPEWWNRKTQQGKADKQLKGEKFIRLERRAAVGQGVTSLPGMPAGGVKPRLLEVTYWPAGESVPARYQSWDQAGTWEVRDTKGPKLVIWRDFTKQERVALGEIDEARYAIAKTLHGMIHDVETGHYLEWLAHNYAKKEGESIDGAVVEASERMRDTFKPGEWVKVPETTITGIKVKKYGILAGRYLPGPIWNDVRQMGGRFKPLGDTYAAILRAWKTSKTALSPAVHMNNVMANFVMADWHDVTAGHVLKALKLMTSKDAAAAEVLARVGESGGSIGTWAARELQQEQLRPLLDSLEKELGIAGNVSGQVGVMSALQLALKGRLPSAWDALKPSKTGQIAVKAARAMTNLYEAEDQVFRLAAWLKAKEEGATDRAAGKLALKSFLDYSINAPWVQMMRSTALPFVAFTYRAVPMMLETAAKKPWKLMKLGLLAGAVNALGYMLSGGDEDDERKLLPEEKAGRVWGITPKLIRMPWNDANGSPVFLDVRRFIPVGDIFDTGQSHSALPLLPSMVPGGPLAVLAELALNSAQFTGKDITLETDTVLEKSLKIADHLYKAMAPNIAILPGTYAWTSIANAGTGKTDTFGREQSLTQAVVSSIGIKLGSYPKDVLRLNAQREAQFKMMEIDRNITALKREYQKHGITSEQFQSKAKDQMDKKRKVVESLQKRL